MEFIVDVQSLAQHGKGKWWRNQPRWLVRGTKQALVKQRLTMCASAKVKGYYPWGVQSIVSKPWLREAMQYIKYFIGVTWVFKDSLTRWFRTLSHWLKYGFAQKDVMQCWNPKIEKVKVWQSWSNSSLKWLKCAWYLILSIGMPYYQEGCNIDWLTRSKVLIGHPKWESWEKNPWKLTLC